MQNLDLRGVQVEWAMLRALSCLASRQEGGAEFCLGRRYGVFRFVVEKLLVAVVKFVDAGDSASLGQERAESKYP